MPLAARMDGMDMAGMAMSSGPAGAPSLSYLQQMYWAVVASFIAAATLVNVTNCLLCRQRLSAAARGDARPAKPKSPVARINATATAMVREAGNAAFAPIFLGGRRIRFPTLGRTCLVAANILTLLVLCFYKFDLGDQWSFEDIGYRTGCISVCQLPLVFLLAGKNNIVGWLTGTSHERLNWLHRWVARCLLLTVTIHMGYWFADWAPYNYIGTKIRTDDITQHGLISWCLLLWIVVSSAAPIRGWRYELFVIQHLASMAVFLAFVYKHVSSWPMYIRIYIWIPVALVCFDRLVRTLWLLYTNLSLFHPAQRKQGHMSSFWACEADFTPLPHNTTRISIRNPPITWTPGQHVFLSCHSVVPLQSHPFTIASIPADGRMDFYVKAEKGGTRRFFRHAEKLHLLPAPGSAQPGNTVAVTVDGPYGRLRPLRQFDSVVLIAGSTGATFTVPLLRHLVADWRSGPKIVARHVRFVWVVKSRGQLDWFGEQLSAVAEDVAALRSAGQAVEVEMSVYVTCDARFTDEHGKSRPSNAGPARGAVEEVRDAVADAAEKGPMEKYAVREIEDGAASSIGEDANDQSKEACGPDGSCCCKTTIEDEDDAIEPAVCSCQCGSNASATNNNTTTTTKSASASSTTQLPTSATSPRTSTTSTLSLLHPHISLLAGRPHPRTLIRKVLEQALGESAVVACGPAGLVDDIRDDVVRLSDERAVHKGTGAQGIYLHVEGFAF